MFFHNLKMPHFLMIVCLVLAPSLVKAAVLTRDTLWSGAIAINEDILVPAGVTLTVAAGSRITVSAAESTKTDPEFLSPLTEITIRGTLKVEGNSSSPVEFSGVSRKSGSWAGVIVDGGTATITACRITDAETALLLFGGSLKLDTTTLSGNRYGFVAQGSKASARLAAGRITANEYGMVVLDGATVTRHQFLVEGNRKRDLYERPASTILTTKEFQTGEAPLARIYGDAVLAGETVWQGRIRVNGTIRVPEGGRLMILPGTIVEFTKKDTNGDGIGENGLLIQGRLLVKGRREAPIVFRSAEKDRRMGDWDSINIMNSDGSQNLIEYCQIEDAYRGAHFHFSNLVITNTVFRNNYRGIQFQESAVEIRDSWLYGNKSGLQGRDSTVVLTGNQILGNYDGANFWRTHLSARDNRFRNNLRDGLRVRESAASFTENLIEGNRFGLLVADIFQGGFNRNVFSGNAEVGIFLKNTDNLELSGNFITGNGLSGLNIQETRATVSGNLFAGNGERGIGIISFSGSLSGNNFVSNGIYALEYEGTSDLALPGNWWGVPAPELVIGDKRIDVKRGSIGHAPFSSVPYLVTWPLGDIPAKALWCGDVAVDTPLIVPKGATLEIAPGTRVLFDKGVGLTVRGKLLAEGVPNNRIVFSARKPEGASSWDEIQMEYAEGSRISHCLFEYATWGLHSHFSPITVSDCLFRSNYGGMRFRSGPMLVTRSVFTGNTIGIRAYIGNAIIRGNLITDNETGIFVREKGGGLTITGNNLAANRGYGIRIGDFNDEDVKAPDNWWGAGEPLQHLFDGRSEPGIGIVVYEPYRLEPFRLEGVEP